MKNFLKKMDHYLNNSFFVFSFFLGLHIFVFSRWFYKQETFDYHIDGFAILGAPWASLWDVFHVLPVMKLDRMGQYFWGHFAWVLFEMNSVAISFLMIWVHAANSTFLMILVRMLGYKKIAFPIALIFCIHAVTTWEIPYLYLAPDSFGVFFAFCTIISFFSKKKYSFLLTLFFYFWAANTKETFLIATPLIIFLLYLVKNSEEKSKNLFLSFINFTKVNYLKIIIISLIALSIIISYIPIYKNSVNTGAGHEAGGYYSLGYNPLDIFYTIGWHISNLTLNYYLENLFAKISKNGFIFIGFFSFFISILGTIFLRAKNFFVPVLCFIIALGPILLLPIFQSPQSRYSYFASSFLFLSLFSFFNFLYDKFKRKRNWHPNYFQLFLIMLVLGITFFSRHSKSFSYITRYYSDFSKIRRNQIVDLKARIPIINQGTYFFIYGLEENTVTNSLRACHGISAVYKMPVGCNFDYDAGFKEALKNAKGEYYILRYSKDMNYIEKIEYHNFVP